ncbi:MAG: translation initiation factor IF-2 [Candidatus Pacearchaeota archaeon]
MESSSKAMEKSKIRQPIVTVCGHVDHGKTSILDSLRGSSVQEGEAGGITQKISFTLYPSSQLRKACPLIDKTGIKLDIPGFLLIDTPGHAAFTNLRKRGGSLADLAVLVIDINEGIKPQTSEVLQILKMNKTPFVIALNKIDNVSGWRKLDDDLKRSIEKQPQRIKQEFDEKYMTLQGALNSYGFDSDLFYNIKDFTQKIALVPCSAKTQEGIPELILMLCGLSQKYLEKKLVLGKEAKGVVLEIKKERNSHYVEAILYDGQLSKTDEIAVSDLEGNPIISKIRVLEEIKSLSSSFQSKEKVEASTGIRMQLIEKVDVLPGMPFVALNKATKKEDVKKMFKQQITESIGSMLSKHGIIAKADSLGSLEALLSLLRQEHIPVLKAGIGNINKSDIISAKANLEINEIDAVIAGFNVETELDAREILGKVKIISEDVVYKLIENLVHFRNEKAKEIEKNRLMELASICKLKILHQYVFRNTNPAIFGVKVETGKIIPYLPLIDEKGEKIGKVKNMQLEKQSVNEAKEGQELAISIPGINFERILGDKNFLYSDINVSQFKTFRKNEDLLSSKELSALSEIEKIKKRLNNN